MDVHRCRFVPFPPSGINSLAFSHISNADGPTPPELRLAIGRANGTIEIWSPANGLWIHETTFGGGRDRSIDTLVWIQESTYDSNGSLWQDAGRLRLFSIGTSTAVTEWDLAKGIPLRNAEANHTALWCLAAQPAISLSQKSSKQLTNGAHDSSHLEADSPKLVVGCDDGQVVMFSTTDDSLMYQRTFSKSASRSSRVLSITFLDRLRIAAGCADGRIKIFDIRNGTQLRTISLGTGPKIASKKILVWTLQSLPNGGLVSGDSTGEVRWFDAINYSQVQRIKTNRSDVISLAVSPDGKMVFSGSMDRRTSVFQDNGARAKGQRWTETFHRRYHTNDVKALASFESKSFSVLVSGGIDNTPIVVPMRKIGTETHRRLPGLPHQSPTCSSPIQRLLVSWWDSEIRIWRILKRDQLAEGQTNHKIVARICLKGDDKISDVSISHDGKLLVVGTPSEIKLFRLRRGKDALASLKIKQLEVPEPLRKTGARLVRLSPDSRWIFANSQDGKIIVSHVIQTPTGNFELPLRFSKLKRRQRPTPKASDWRLRSSLGEYVQNVTQASFSADSRILVVADREGFLESWVLKHRRDSRIPQTNGVTNDGAHESSSSSEEADTASENEEETEDQYWVQNPAPNLPRLPSSPLILSFRPRSGSERLRSNGVASSESTESTSQKQGFDEEDRLLVLTEKHQLLEYSVLTGFLSDWSRRNPTSLFPSSFSQVKDRAIGCVWDIRGEIQRIWIYGSVWVWMFNLALDFPAEDATNKTDVSDMEVDSHSQVANGVSGYQPSQTNESRGKKRKRPAKDSGAGGEKPSSESNVGRIGPDAQGSRAENGVFSPKREDKSGEDEDEDGEDDVGFALQRRSGMADRDLAADDRQDKADDKPHSRALVVSQDDSQHQSQLSSWHTFQYEPILGMVGLSIPGDSCLEVVIVERPSWDTEQIAPVFGDQEWSRR